jgi:hypothetical protein
MNVTVKIPDDLCRKARHCAVDENKSLSAWLADLVKEKLESTSRPAQKSWSDAFSDYPESFYEQDLPLENRSEGTVRETDFLQ